MSSLNLRNGTVIYTGVVGALVQAWVQTGHVNNSTVTTIITASLTILVAIHGALTNSVFDGSKRAQEADKFVSEAVTILGDVPPNTDLGEK